MKFFVRPFKTIIERGMQAPALSVSAQIIENCFRFEVDGAAFNIPALKVGNDQLGAFAIIEETVQDLRDGFRLSVALDPPSAPDAEPGCTISFYKPNSEQARMQKEYTQGIVLLPPGTSVSVDFGSFGQLSGQGIMLRSSSDLNNLPPIIKH